MPNIPAPATNVLPGVITNIVTQSVGASVPGGVRIASIIGEGARSEIIVAAALGDGQDGLDGYYKSTTNADGRHFLLSLSPVVPNRTQLFKNGIQLVGIEGSISFGDTFPPQYDYQFDPATGEIELQQAQLVDEGGTLYITGATNVGVGTLQNLELVDVNAPNETWTIKCVSVQRNNLNQPIAGTAVFVAFGSVSGNVLNANGVPFTWIANNQVVSNGIISFSILETTNGPSTISPFRQGDYFTVQVKSGVLSRNDSLTAAYIAESDINSPTFFSTMKDITTKHGPASLNNTLTLGCQLAFANATPGIMCVQAAPPLPRRISYELETNFNATSSNFEDFVIPLPFNVTPDPNSNIHIFVTNPSTEVETQLLANKFPFDTLGTVGNPTISQFVFDDANPPAGNSFSYSVVQEAEALNFAQDGYLNRNSSLSNTALFSSASIGNFTLSYVGKFVTVIDATNLANIGTWAITGVTDGALQILAINDPPAHFFTDYVNDTSVSFELINSLTGQVVPGSSGSDGTLLTSGANTAQGTFTSTAIDFSTFPILADGYSLRVTASTTSSNIGLFDIIAVGGGSHPTLTIRKAFVSEHNLKFEVIDPSLMSSFLVLNHNIVPNGYNLRVTVVDVKDAPFFDAGWETALASLETQEIDILVPLPSQTISVIFQNCVNHCLTMSNLLNRKERVLYIGAINGLTPSNLTGATLAAVENIGVLEGIQGATISDVLSGNTEDLANYSVSAAYGDTFRVVYFFPDQIVVQVGSDNQILSGYYIAAAAAGYTSGVSNVASPLTRKILSGFSILTNRMFNQITYQGLAAAGVTSLIPVQGGGQVLWGITTSQSGFPEEQEISIVFIRDRIAKTMRAAFDGLIGVPEDADTTGTITARAIALLNSFIQTKLITNFADLTVAQDSVEPRQWDITVRVQPVYPVNWIYITVGVGIIS